MREALRAGTKPANSPAVTRVRAPDPRASSRTGVPELGSRRDQDQMIWAARYAKISPILIVDNLTPFGDRTRKMALIDEPGARAAGLQMGFDINSSLIDGRRKLAEADLEFSCRRHL